MNFPTHKSSLFLTHNPHKNIYEKIELYIYENCELFIWPEGEREQALLKDELWMLTWYPDTPVGSYAIAASTLEKLLDYAKTI